MADIPDELIKLERSAEEARAALSGLEGAEYKSQWVAWYEAAVAFQAAVTSHAEAVGEPRVAVEMAAKKAARYADSVS